MKKIDELALTDWYPDDVKPVRAGVYKTAMGMHALNTGFSFWNGKEWGCQHDLPAQADADDEPGWQRKNWRGVRRWVLVQTDNIIARLAGEPVDVYLISARPRSAKFGGLASARPFKDKRTAERFAARFAHLGLVAVLP